MADTRIMEKIYEINYGAELGGGTQGRVYKAVILESQEEICVKIAKRNPANKRYLDQEIQIAQILKSSENFLPCVNIVKFYDVFQESNLVYTFMEKCDKSLQDELQEKTKSNSFLQEKVILNYLYQIVQGYLYFKARHIIHRDLKPENILIKVERGGDYTLKVSDFGVGKLIDQCSPQTQLGTPAFTAPEVYQHSTYTDQCDIYSLGLMAHTMIYGNLPFEINSLQKIKRFWEEIQKQKFQCQETDRVQIALQRIVAKMIVYDPGKRITWEQLEKELRYLAEKIAASLPIQDYNTIENYITQLHKLSCDAVRTLCKFRQFTRKLKLDLMLAALSSCACEIALKTYNLYASLANRKEGEIQIGDQHFLISSSRFHPQHFQVSEQEGFVKLLFNVDRSFSKQNLSIVFEFETDMQKWCEKSLGNTDFNLVQKSSVLELLKLFAEGVEILRPYIYSMTSQIKEGAQKFLPVVLLKRFPEDFPFSNYKIHSYSRSSTAYKDKLLLNYIHNRLF